MAKKKKLPKMAGANDGSYLLRLPKTLLERFAISCAEGKAGEVNRADVLRRFIEMRCEFTETKKRQPLSMTELCEWYLARNAPTMLQAAEETQQVHPGRPRSISYLKRKPKKKT